MGSLRRRVLAIAAITILIAACGNAAPSATPPAASPSPTGSIASASPLLNGPSAPPSRGTVSDGPIASSGSIAALGADGSLSIIDAAGRSVLVATTAEGAIGFPAWSPDGSLIAAPRSGPASKSVVIFDAQTFAEGRTVGPLEVFSSPTIEPFYLYWKPDGDSVSFLATDGSNGELGLRIAPADARDPQDGSEPGSLIRTGNPLYYDWLGADRLLAHIGTGPKAFLGEIGIDGTASGGKLGAPGDFRSVAVSADRKWIAFMGAAGREGEVVLAARDGSRRHTLTVLGSAAMEFDPAGPRLASIGPVDPTETAAFPVGPLRITDAASGDTRTLIDGRVVSFWWAPDGKTIAAIRIQNAAATASPTASASPAPSASPAEPDTEIRLLFVDVASGKVRSQPLVSPTPTFVNGVLAYFDQYALSHRLWAPDSSSILLPELADDGTSRLSVLFPDGAPPISFEGELGFWSP